MRLLEEVQHVLCASRSPRSKKTMVGVLQSATAAHGDKPWVSAPLVIHDHGAHFGTPVSAYRPAHQPPRGWHSETKLDPKPFQSDPDLTKVLDSVVGCMRWLGGSPSRQIAVATNASRILTSYRSRHRLWLHQGELQRQGENVDGDIAHARKRLVEVDQERAFYQRQAARGKITEQEFDVRMEETKDVQ
jgi:hypothetical protein